jgi:hypothetical protein
MEINMPRDNMADEASQQKILAIPVMICWLMIISVLV